MRDGESEVEDPIAEKQGMREVLSQETRHPVLQLILGHPAHLASLAEFDYMIPKNEAAILDQLETLQEAGILDVYVHESNVSTRNLPSKFWGLTERGVKILYEHTFLRGVPVARAVYEETKNPSGCSVTRTHRGRRYLKP